jgi:hypothetical protein
MCCGTVEGKTLKKSIHMYITKKKISRQRESLTTCVRNFITLGFADVSKNKPQHNKIRIAKI